MAFEVGVLGVSRGHGMVVLKLSLGFSWVFTCALLGSLCFYDVPFNGRSAVSDFGLAADGFHWRVLDLGVETIDRL